MGHYLDSLDHIRAITSDPLVMMASYPEAVTLTIMFSDPRIINLALQPFGPRLDPFYKEIRYRLNIPYEPRDGIDPLVRWRVKLHRRQTSAGAG
jgi:hypothetical protein